MASGGGSHPSHLPIASHNNQVIGGSLQTPDASALFISSLGESNSGRSRACVNNFAPSPLDQTQSFTSLEELLNVTGISSSELDQSGSGSGGGGMGKDRDGVDSLQRIAKEVEKNQGWLMDGHSICEVTREGGGRGEGERRGERGMSVKRVKE